MAPGLATRPPAPQRVIRSRHATTGAATGYSLAQRAIQLRNGLSNFATGYPLAQAVLTPSMRFVPQHILCGRAGRRQAQYKMCRRLPSGKGLLESHRANLL